MIASVDVDRAVSDTIHLESLPGVVERLLQQCHDVGAPRMAGIRQVADSVTLDLQGPLRPVTALRMFSVLSVVVSDFEDDRHAGYDAAVGALGRSREHGVLSALGQGDPVGFRVGPMPDRWELRDRISGELGWRNDPGAWHVNLARCGELLLAQVGGLSRSSRFPAMARMPASTNPLIAALLVQLLKPRSGDVVYDPFCGSGTLLVEAAASDPGLVLIGSDVSLAALTAAVANRALFPSGVLMRADACRLPVATGSVDRVISNLPFGKRVGSHALNAALYPAFLAELGRVLRADGRAALLTEDKRLLRHSVEATAGLRLLREVKLATGGLHPSAFVLERTRTARRANAKRRAVSP